jgi:hypothetical protein
MSVATQYNVEWKEDRWVVNWKRVEGSGSGLTEVLFMNSPGWIERNHDNWCPGRDSNREPPKYKSEALQYFFVVITKKKQRSYNWAKKLLNASEIRV